MMKILMIDEDVEFGEVIKDVLIENGYEVDFVTDAYQGIKLEKENHYDLIMIDLYLKKFSGTQLAELIRSHNKKSKIIITTDSTDDADEIQTLKLDIDEFLRKNISINVGLQRIKHVLEKKSKVQDSDDNLCSESEKITMNLKNRIVKHSDELVQLTQLEFDLLELFLQNKNKLFSRTEILELVWKLDEETIHINSRTVDVHVKNLRKKLDLKAIHSIRGIGYRWYEAIQE